MKKSFTQLFLVISLCFLLCVSISCQNQAAKAELEEMKAQAEVEEQNKEIAKVIFTAIDAGDFDRLNELFADDFALDTPGLPEPLRKDMLFQLIKTHHTAFPDWIHVIEGVIADGDKVAVKLTQNRTHKAEYEGIPATGIKATLPTIHLITIVDGKIKEWFAVDDYIALYYMQLGIKLKRKEAEK